MVVRLISAARHGRQADQRRNKEKDHREHFPDSPHSVRIFAISRIIGKITSVIYIPFRHIQILYFFLRICKFLLCVFDLLFSVRKLCLCFRLALVILFPSVCKFLLS